MVDTTPNAALARLRAGKVALGLSVGLLPAPAMPMLARTAGYDWLAIDMEHSPLGLPEVARLSVLALPLGVTPVVRVRLEGLHDGVRALDAGAQGLLVPNVETAEQARRITDAVRFAPEGTRSWGAGAPTFGFAPPPVAEAARQLNRETLAAAMIETQAGLDNAAAIAAVPGIDALFVGTVDLSLALGIPGGADDPALWAALERVAAACREHGKALGVGGLYDEQSLPRLLGLGALLLAGGSDQGFLLQAAGARARLISRLAAAAGLV